MALSSSIQDPRVFNLNNVCARIVEQLPINHPNDLNVMARFLEDRLKGRFTPDIIITDMRGWFIIDHQAAQAITTEINTFYERAAA